MADHHHIQSDHYAQVRGDVLPSASLALKVFDHLVTVCPECAAAWRQIAGARREVEERLTRAAERYDAERSGRPRQEPTGYELAGREDDWSRQPDHHLPTFSPEARVEQEELDRIRSIRRHARRQSWKLRRTPAPRRRRRIERAISQFRSRAVAEHLLDRCRELIRDDPAEAGSLASLVPLVLEWTTGDEEAPWAAGLLARAAAWEANALRVAGDLPAADRAFAALRSRFALEPLEDLGVQAELFSLEASLRIGQRRWPEAEALLDQAGLLLRHIGDEPSLVRLRVKQGNLLTSMGRHRQALVRFDQATALLPCDGDLHTRMTVVIGRVVALCELMEYAEARRLLGENLTLFEDSDELYAGAMLRSLQGRIALGEGRLTEAEGAFRACREGYLAADRTYDAALATLDVAEVCVRMKRFAELRELADELVPIFRARGVPRETLATLRLFFDASRAEQLTLEALARLRSALVRTTPSSEPTT